MMKNRLPNPTNVRFDDKTKARVKSVANAHGLTESDIIRVAVLQKLPEWEKGKIILTARMG